MGGNPRYQTWTPNQWHSFQVLARCTVCGLAMDVRLATVAREMGGDYVLWGRSVPCRRRHCQGRMWFYCLPPKLGAEAEMF